MNTHNTKPYIGPPIPMSPDPQAHANEIDQPHRLGKILRMPKVRVKTGLSRATIYAEMAKGNFPRKIQLFKRSVGWLESEIEDWIAIRVRRRE